MSKQEEIKDYLNYKHLREIKKIIGNEVLLFSDKIVKLDKYNMSKERKIIITNSKIYNLSKKSMLKIK
jgi:uncharacterized protein (UPF0216 family)